MHSSLYVLYSYNHKVLGSTIWYLDTFVCTFRNYTESIVVLFVDVPLESSEAKLQCANTPGSSFVSFLSHDMLSNAYVLLILLCGDQPLIMAFLMDFICSNRDLRRKEMRTSSCVLSKDRVCWGLTQCWVSRPNHH